MNLPGRYYPVCLLTCLCAIILASCSGDLPATPTVDVAATSATLASQEQATATAVAQSTAEALDELAGVPGAKLVYGPVSGVQPEDSGVVFENTSLHDFVFKVRLHNLEDADNSCWFHFILFKIYDTKRYFLEVATDPRMWFFFMTDIDSSAPQGVSSRPFVGSPISNLNTEPAGFNEYRVLVKQDRVSFSLNGADLTPGKDWGAPDFDHPGNIGFDARYCAEKDKPGPFMGLHYDNFTVWSLDP
ncbi:MAG TPA: hypothetical protein VEX13_17775 [Chloroflexia bacterium]|nr:hypothetical protein [Chloroflexia bacterium]